MDGSNVIRTLFGFVNPYEILDDPLSNIFPDICGPPQGDDTEGIVEHEEHVAEEEVATPSAFHINLSNPPAGESSTDPQGAAGGTGTLPSGGEGGEPAVLQLNTDVYSAGEDTNLTRHPVAGSVKYGTTQE